MIPGIQFSVLVSALESILAYGKLEKFLIVCDINIFLKNVHIIPFESFGKVFLQSNIVTLKETSTRRGIFGRFLDEADIKLKGIHN